MNPNEPPAARARPALQQRRQRKTRRSVRIAERCARLMISIGGIGTIIAVSLIFAFLLWVVAPLFRGADYLLAASTGGAVTRTPLSMGVDEYRLLGWVLMPDGELLVSRLDDGSLVERRALFPAGAPTACSPSAEGGTLALGFADGSLRTLRLGFRTEYIDPAQDVELARALEATPLLTRETRVVQRTVRGELRSQHVEVDIGEAIPSGCAAPIQLIDLSGERAQQIAVLDATGSLALLNFEQRENLLTGEVTSSTERFALPRQGGEGLPAHLLLAGGGDMLYLAWNDGRTERYDLRDPAKAGIVEQIDLVEGAGTLTALEFLIGKTSIISADSDGRVRCWFNIKPDGAGTRDGARMVLAHTLREGGPHVTALAPSARSRVIAAGFEDGSTSLWHVTSHKELVRAHEKHGPVLALAIAPKEDGMVALTTEGLLHWQMELGHPEASLGALFLPVWYEGYEQPEHAWQSSSGTDDFEPKLGLWPLVFGTLKATLYSMLFGVPIALLAALYTSEFMSPRLRTPLKSLTEVMASLPSVVLGFLAALILAPFVQQYLPVVLAAMFAVPFTLLFGAHLWQLLPQRHVVRWSGARRFAAMAASLPLGVLLAFACAPLLERVLFGGNVESWLSSRSGSTVGGWILLLAPLALCAVVLFLTHVVNPWLRRRSMGWDRARSARAELVKFVLAALATVALAAVVGLFLDGLSLDPRGSLIDTYVQRNALVVGFVMGFAVIPIVYTLVEDALSSVPSYLRLASLGAGATQWQTAVRVVLPTAMSGIFSAIMIGLGRAVGETMIVLMATGNTPVMSWNAFNGFRTLSANVAVELPEAVRNSTHYRTLFLAGLCLFAMTFAFNTAAEIVRQRFRKRAFQL